MYNKKIFQFGPEFVILIVLCLFFAVPIQAMTNQTVPDKSEQKVFKAGAARSNITPHLGGIIVGGWVGTEAAHIHDDLHVRTLVLDDGANKLAFVVADVLGVHQDLADAAKRLISGKTGIPFSNIIISAIHTHSATSVMGVGNTRRDWNVHLFDDYQRFVIQRIADCVQVAVNNLEPARIGWGIVSAPEHVFVRRWNLKEPIINPFGEYDKVQMNPGHNNTNKLTPAGVPDPDVSFISVQSAEGRPIALFANYSLHYVGGVPRNDISADYFAVFSDHIQELLNADRQDPPFIGIMSNGTSGDVNNINYGGTPERNEPYAKMRYVGRDIAQKVFEANKTIKYHDWVPLRARLSEVTLEVRKPDQKTIERAKTILSRHDSIKPMHPHERNYAERTFTQLRRPEKINIPLHVFGIGDLGVASIPFEVFAETGLEIKEKSPFDQTFVIGIAGGYYGYLPTPKQHELGGYETWLGSSSVEIEASEKIVAELLTLLKQIE